MSTVCCGVGPGGSTSMLAKITVVDFRGSVVLDTYVAPTSLVTDYRTASTGIGPDHLNSPRAMPFSLLQSRLAELLKGKIITGYSLWLDLSVLGIPHPAVATRDIALYYPFRQALQSQGQVIGLQTLMWHFMRRRCCSGPLNSLENARAALDLYRSVGDAWENSIRSGQWPSGAEGVLTTPETGTFFGRKTPHYSHLS